MLGGKENPVGTTEFLFGREVDMVSEQAAFRTVNVLAGQHKFKCRIGRGLATVNPCHEFSVQDGFIADDRVPPTVAVVLRGSVVRVLELPAIQNALAERFPDKTLAEVLKADRMPWQKSTPATQHVTLVLDHCNWAERGAAWRVYQSGRFVPMFEKDRFACPNWPTGVKFLELPDEGLAGYVVQKLKAGKFPDLPNEYIVTYNAT